jgi:predicted metal-dependent peptidase
MISKKQWQDICLSLLDHHSLFYKIVEMGRPIFTDTIPTACVTFDKNGKFFNFLFNPEFWESCSDYKKLFVVAHEALHIILNHGKRFKDSLNPQLSNVAIDIVVNHALVNRFGFIREKIEGHEEICWVDTIFKNTKNHGLDISVDENAEYYLNLLQRNSKNLNLNNFKLVDGHNFDETDKQVFDVLNSELTDEEKKGLKKFYDTHKDKKSAGDTGGDEIHFANSEKLIVKKKWESVIENWAKKLLINADHNVEQWAKQHRRFAMLGGDLFLPSESEIEDLTFDKRKIVVNFYLDTSGSCWHLKDRFFSAAESLPSKFFDVRLFCFDTVVYETSLSSKKIYGNGGTKFDVIENSILKNEVYPDAVFVITDLYGNKVNPKYPERWHWFAEGSKHVIDDLKKDYLPEKSKVFMLNDFI